MGCGGAWCQEAGEAAVRLLAGMVLLCVARNALALVCLPPRRVRGRGGSGGGGGDGALPGRVPRRILEGAPSRQGPAAPGRDGLPALPGPCLSSPRSALKRPSSDARGTPAAAPTQKPPEQRRRTVSPAAGGRRRAKASAPGPHRRAPRSPDSEERAEAGAAMLFRWLGAPATEAGRASAEGAAAAVRKPLHSGSAPPGPELVLMAAEEGFQAPGPLLLLRARAPPDPSSAGKVVYDAQWVHCAEAPRGPPRRNRCDGRTARFGQ